MNLELTKRAIKDLDALERSQQKYFKHIISKIHTLADEPLSGKQLVGPLKGKLSLRVGDYRIIYKIEKATVFILTINHRRDVYK